MTRAVLDLSPEQALAITAAVPLGTVILAHTFGALLSVVPKRFNLFISPDDGLPDAAPRAQSKRSAKHWLLALFALVHALFWATLAVRAALADGSKEVTFAVELGLISVGWLYAALSPIVAPSDTAPLLLFAFYIEHALAIALHFITVIIHGTSTNGWVAGAVLGCTDLFLIALALSFGVEQPLSAAELADRKKQAIESEAQATPPPGVEMGKDPLMPSPERTASLAGWLSFTWAAGLMRLAIRRKVQYPDLWPLPDIMQTATIHGQAEQLKRPSLMGRVFWLNSRDFVTSLSLALLTALLRFATPFCINRILASLAAPPPGQAPDPNARASAFMYAGLMFLAAFLRAETDLLGNWANIRLSMRSSSLAMQEVYVKALKRRDTSGATSDDTKQAAASQGKVLQFINGDSTKVAGAITSLTTLLVAPVEIVIAIVSLYYLLGWTCFVGLLFPFAISPVQTRMMKTRFALMRVVIGARDVRTQKVTEFINAIRFVKYSAGESAWLKRVFESREVELAATMARNMNALLMVALWTITPDVTQIIALAAAALVGKRQFDIAILFTALSLFGLLSEPMAQAPHAITSLQEAKLAFERLEGFFKEDEVDQWVSALKNDGQLKGTESKVAIVNGTFTYKKAGTGEATEAAEQFSLRNINLDFPLGQLSLVCGPTGSGKTSLLLALLGEVEIITGKTYLPKGAHTVDSTGLYDGVAYCSQLPWLQHATIQDNITFGSKFDKARYDAVIDACALQPDLKQFEAGDQTEIGEKGISLSGGQKARVALARAVYSRAKTVLLDDPLSAVDSHTAKHLFKKCLKGPLLKGRTVILVTHHVALCLRGAAFVVRVQNGAIESQGDANTLDKSLIGQEEAYNLDDDAEDETELVEALAESDAVKKAIATEAPAAAAATPARASGKLITPEANKTGSIGRMVYMRFMNAVGWDIWCALFVCQIGRRLIQAGSRVFISAWGASYRVEAVANFFGSASQTVFSAQVMSSKSQFGIPFLDSFPSASDNPLPWLGAYALIKVIVMVITQVNLAIGYYGYNRASRTLFRNALTRVSRAPFRYWDTTPTGRVLSRFAADFDVIDSNLPMQVSHSLNLTFNFLIDLTVILLVSPVFILPAVVIVYFYTALGRQYIHSSRDLRRLTANARSPIFSHFGEVLSGLSTVRAFGAERDFVTKVGESINTYQSASYAASVVKRYLNWRFDLLGAAAVAITTVLALLSGAGAGKAAIAIVSAQALVEGVDSMCSMAAMVETDANAVERVVELLDTPQEPPAIVEGKRPAANWPSDTGSLVIEDLVLSYAPDLPAVVKGVSFTVNPREKVGLVGRTGSGKSTMALSLLRFTEPTSGKIIIDGVDITQIGLDDLRSRLTLIPQEAVLFSGTVRSNLDPFNQLTDAACLDALARVHLTDFSSSTSGDVAPAGSGRLSVSLDDAVSAGGLNFSAGQRQLLAMARALLRRSKVIIMDEATASVDMATDSKIQQTIAEEFESSIVLCIAHRLKTVISMDKILVLDSGVVVEYDTPKKLLENKEGAFYKMCEASSEWEELKRVVGLA